MPSLSLQRGTVILVDLNPSIGHEQAGTRPALILSHQTFNESRAELVTVLPITTRQRQLDTRIVVEAGEGGLREKSWVIADQIRTISTLRILSVWGRLRIETLVAIQAVVRDMLF